MQGLATANEYLRFLVTLTAVVDPFLAVPVCSAAQIMDASVRSIGRSAYYQLAEELRWTSARPTSFTRS